jgi:type VI secretion system protein ImpJ
VAETLDRAIPDPVQWHEGMLLAPQHFQQLSTRVELQLQRLAVGAALPAWGVRRCVLDTERLAAGILRLLEADVVLRDGYRFCVDRADGLELDLTPLAEQARQEPLSIFVTVPASPGLRTEGELARYRSAESGPVRDDTGESEIALPVLRPKVGLWAGSALPARFEGVPVARIRRRDEAFVLDPYHPPGPELAPDSELHAGCAALARVARDKALLLAERLQNGSLAGDLPALWQTRLQLSHLTASLPGLEALLGDAGVHPRLLHLRLCDLAGQLASLSFGLVPPHFPAYDHADLASSFRPLLHFAGQAMAEGVSEKWQRIRLAATGAEFRSAPDGWLDAALPVWESHREGCVVALGLRCPAGAGPAAMERWANEAVVTGAGALEELLENRTLGLGRRLVNQLPGLIAPAGVCLFTLDPDVSLVRPRDSVVVLGSPDVEPAPVEVMLFVRRFENGRVANPEGTWSDE